MIIGLPGFIAEEQICNYLLFKTLISKAVCGQIAQGSGCSVYAQRFVCHNTVTLSVHD